VGASSFPLGLQIGAVPDQYAAAVKRARPRAENQRLRITAAVFMLGGAPRAHEFLPEKWRLVPMFLISRGALLRYFRVARENEAARAADASRHPPTIVSNHRTCCVIVSNQSDLE
jgi:hypothetical protein